MELSLQHRIALVTGGSRGTGKVIARTLAEEGADIILVGRDGATLRATQSELRTLPVKVVIAQADVTNGAEVKKIFEEIVSPLGRLDILVNNVGGVPKFGDFLALEEEDWREAIDLNFMSMVHCARYAIPWLKKSEGGRIINIATVPARQPGAFNPHYSAAKAAMLNLNKHLANLLAKDGVLVNALCPSTLQGEAWERNIAHRATTAGVSHEAARQTIEEEEKKKVPLQKVGTPEDVAALVAFLASSKARYITGTVIGVDGGTVRSIF